MESENSKLKKVLNSRDLIALAFGAAIGWSWIALLGEWLTTAGTIGAIFGFLIGGFVVMLIGIAYAELTASLPDIGGSHGFTLKGLGYKGSFICSWALTLSYIGVVAFEACALPFVLESVFPALRFGYLYTVGGTDIYLSSILFGVFSSLMITYINYKGMEFSSWIQRLFFYAIFGVGILLVIASLTKGSMDKVPPYFVDGLDGLMKVAVMTPFLLVGFDVIPQASAEADLPPRRLAKLMLASIVIATVWYCIIIFCVSSLVSRQELMTSELPTATALVNGWGGAEIAKLVVVIGGLCGILSSWNAFIVAGSRVLYQMSRSEMLPAWFGELDEKSSMPDHSVIFIGLLSCAAPFFGFQFLIWISNVASLSTIIAYGLTVLAFVRLRKIEPWMKRPYRIKGGKYLGPVAVVIAVAMLVLYLPGMPSGLNLVEWVLTGAWALLGLVIYQQSVRKKKERSKPSSKT